MPSWPCFVVVAAEEKTSAYLVAVTFMPVVGLTKIASSSYASPQNHYAFSPMTSNSLAFISLPSASAFSFKY